MSTHNAKLTEQTVQDVRARYAMGGNTYMSLAEEYNVDPATIGYIVRGVTWKWVIGGGTKVTKPPHTPSTHCKKGHEFTESNTLLVKRDDKMHRRCRACHYENKRKSDRRRRGNYR